jgi:hypothetical protein
MERIAGAFLALLLAGAAVAACQSKGQPPAEPEADQKTAAEDENKNESGQAEPGAAAGSDHAAEQDHGEVEVRAGKGPMDEKLGQELTGAKKVSVAQLQQDPEAWAGKTVRLEGEVTDMCVHRRGWFGIAGADGKKVVRVLTSRAGFRVPVGAVGCTAKAEGRVKVVTLDPKELAHYRKVHKFVSDEEIASGESVRQPVVLATGAEFRRQ